MRYIGKHSILNKLYYVLVVYLAISCLTSCQGDDENNDSLEQRPAITFDKPVINSITRTMYDYEQVIPYNTGESFRIFGVKYEPGTADNKIWTSNKEYNATGEMAGYDSSLYGWDTNSPHFWTKGLLYAFRAFSPYLRESTGTQYKFDNDVQGLDIINYETPVMGKQFDLMYSNAIYDVHGPTPKVNNDGTHGYSGVNLVFNHALSSVHFYVTINYDYIKNIDWELRAGAASKFKIKQITIGNVYNKGTFNENGGIQGVAGSRTYKPGVPTWTIDTISKGTDYNFVGTTPVSGIPFNMDDVNKDVSKDIKTLNTDAHIGFMIPQALPADATLMITWMFDGVDQPPIKVNLQKLTPKWERGKRYKYIIKLSRDKFYFDSSVSDMVGPGNDIGIQ